MKNIKTVDELLIILFAAVIGMCIIFGIFLYIHERKRKKEIRNNEKKR